MPGSGFVFAPFEYPCTTNLRKLYSIIAYILLFTQAPVPVCLDGTIIESRSMRVPMYHCGYVGV